MPPSRIPIVGGMTKRKNKPKRPEGCPLYPHASGSWTATLAGKKRSFGGWSDLPAALRKYEMCKAKLLMGEDPFTEATPTSKRASSQSIADIVDRFIEAKASECNRGIISPRTLKQVTYEISKFSEQHGKVRIDSLTPEKWTEISQSFPAAWSLNMFNTRVKIVRSCFNFAQDSGWVQPMRYGKFCVVKQNVMRKAKAKKPPRLYTAEEIVQILEFSHDDLKACILLSLSTGMGGTDLSQLRLSDIKGGFIVGRRSKTQVTRKAPVWSEVAELLDKLDTGKDECLFKTQTGLPLVGAMEHSSNYQSAFKRACKRAGVENRGPYLLRSVTQTICEQTNVPLASLATSRIMGHKRTEISETYRKEDNIPDWQIRRCSDYLHAWLYKSKVWQEVASIRNTMHSDTEDYYHQMQDTLEHIKGEHPELF